MTEPIQTDLNAWEHRNRDIRIAVMIALGFWVLGFGLDTLFRFLFHEPRSRSLPFLVLSQSMTCLLPTFSCWDVNSRAIRIHTVFSILSSVIVWVLTVILEPTRSVVGFMICTPLMAVVAYNILPVYRCSQEVHKDLRAKAKARKRIR